MLVFAQQDIDVNAGYIQNRHPLPSSTALFIKSHMVTCKNDLTLMILRSKRCTGRFITVLPEPAAPGCSSFLGSRSVAFVAIVVLGRFDAGCLPD
jgi:hypothetical protein